MNMYKLDIHDYIIKSGIGYTFIDVGLWYTVPGVGISDSETSTFESFIKDVYSTRNVKNAFIHQKDIGRFVSLILLDLHTLNRYVFCYSEELTKKEILALAYRISGKEIKVSHVSEEEIINNINNTQGVEYVFSMWIRGDNRVENAKKFEYGEALDAKELYPDLEPTTLEAYAEEFYSQ